MEFETSTLMSLFFMLSLVITLFKVWVFLPNKVLKDDDKTQEATQELETLMIEVILINHGKLNPKELYEKMLTSPQFNAKKFWRFNQNRLNQLLLQFYTKHTHIQGIENIYTFYKGTIRT